MEPNKDQIKNGNFAAANFRGGHLSDDEIIAYQYGNLPSPEVEQSAQNHLVECRRCAGLLLELNEFAESPVELSNAQNTDVEWARFEEKRRDASKNVEQVSTAKSPTNFWNKYFGLSSFNPAMAAAFTVLLLVLGGTVFLALFNSNRDAGGERASVMPKASLSAVAENSAEPKKPFPENINVAKKTNSDVNSNRPSFNRAGENTDTPHNKAKNKLPFPHPVKSPIPPASPHQSPVFNDELALNTMDAALYPNESVRGEAADRRVIRVKKTVERLRLKLNAPNSENLSAFSVEIVGSQKNANLTLPVQTDKRGGFYLTVPVNKLPADIYSLKIYADQNKARRLFTEYEFELEYQ